MLGYLLELGYYKSICTLITIRMLIKRDPSNSMVNYKYDSGIHFLAQIIIIRLAFVKQKRARGWCVRFQLNCSRAHRER